MECRFRVVQDWDIGFRYLKVLGPGKVADSTGGTADEIVVADL